MRLLILLSLIGLCRCIRPRGVRAELASMYNPTSDFSCLDGSDTIPFIQVNDDYCDCDDGSDEPGTAACPNGNFYCENKGHNPLVIPSSRVNDGICDCCDGSDEWESGSVCQDTCMEMGRAAREAAEAAVKIAMEGFTVKQSMINEANRLQEEKMQEISEKESRLLELQTKREEKRLAKEAAEAPEKEALDFYRQLEDEENKKKEDEEKAARDEEAVRFFNSLDTNQDGVVTIEELQARTGLDTNKDGSVSDEEAKFFLSGHESFDLDTFKSVGFSILKPYLELEQSTEAPLLHDENLETESADTTATPDDPEVYDPWRANQMLNQESESVDPAEAEDDEDDREDEDDEDYDIADPPSLPDQMEEASKIEDKYDEKTRGLIAAANEARQEYEQVEREFTGLEGSIKRMKEEMEKDYGPDNEFMVISGQCFEYTDNEYTYKMCPYGSCTQLSKNGGSETRLGSWSSWEGPEGNKYSKMKFSGGQQCWNGPTRSAAVFLHCGKENILTSVSEPNRCEYEMHFTTPASCAKPNLGHDEL